MGPPIPAYVLWPAVACIVSVDLGIHISKLVSVRMLLYFDLKFGPESGHLGFPVSGITRWEWFLSKLEKSAL